MPTSAYSRSPVLAYVRWYSLTAIWVLLILPITPATLGAQDNVRAFRFIENRGQWGPEVAFAGRTGEGLVSFTPQGIDRSFRVVSSDAEADFVVSTRFLHASPLVRIDGEELAGGVHHFYDGPDPASHVENARDFRRVRYDHIYPGIDLLYHESQGRLKYDFILEPGAFPSHIMVRTGGISGVSVDPAGRLVMKTPFGTLREDPPYSYQEVDGRRVEVDVDYVVIDSVTYGFRVESWDPSRPLVIDPCMALEYLTFLGGGDYDEVTSMAIDSAGFSYAVGMTRATSFPTIPQANVPTPQNRAFVTKIAPDGTSLVYSALFGPEYIGLYDEILDESTGQVIGQRYEPIGEDVAVDPSGRAVVAFTTNQQNLPSTPGAVQEARTPNNIISACGPPTYDNFDLFVMRLGNNGQVEWGTYLGGSEDDYLRDLAVGPDGRVAVTGMTVPPICGARGDTLSFPTTVPDGGYGPDVPLRNADIFVSLIDNTGRNLLYSALYGGSGPDYAGGVAFDPASQDLYIVGSTGSNDFPTTSGAWRENAEPGLGGGVFDVVVGRIDPVGGTLEYSTYLPDGGGAGRRGLGYGGFARRPQQGRPLSGLDREDIFQGIIVEAPGQVLLGGSTRSTTLPVTGGALQGSNGNPSGSDSNRLDAWLIRFDMNGGGIRTATYLGGSGPDLLGGLATTREGNIAVGVSTGSTDYPRTRVNIQDRLRGKSDGALSVLTPGLNGLDFSTYVGGTAVSGARLWEQSVRGVSVSPDGGIYLFGGTVSTNLPLTDNALQRTNDYFGGWIAKFVASTTPRIGAPLSIDFPVQACASTQTSGALIFNGGTDPLRIDSIRFSRRGPFTIVNPPTFPLVLGACDSITIIVGFDPSSDTIACDEVLRDTILYYSSNAAVPLVRTPMVARKGCVSFELRDTEINDPRYALGAARGYNLLAFVRGAQAQYVTVEPDPANDGTITTRGVIRDMPVFQGTTTLDFDVVATDTGRYCATFYVTIEPCTRRDTVRICTYVRSGFFNIVPENLDLGLIPCGETEFTSKIFNSGNDTLEFRHIRNEGPFPYDLYYPIKWDSMRRLAPGDTFEFTSVLRPLGFGERRVEPVFETNEILEREQRQIVRAELDTVIGILSTTSVVGAWSDLLDLPIRFDLSREGRAPLRELSLVLEYDMNLLELIDIGGEGKPLQNWSVVESRPVDGGRYVRLKVGEKGTPLAGGGEIGTMRLRVLRGDSIETPIRISLGDPSALCMDASVDSSAAFRLSEECIAWSRLLTSDNRMLRRPWPNPSGPTLHIPYRVPVDGTVTLTLYDASGDRAMILHEGRMQEGPGEILLQTGQLPPGLYFCRMVVNGLLTDVREVMIAR